jgi:hypothetical protein
MPDEVHPWYEDVLIGDSLKFTGCQFEKIYDLTPGMLYAIVEVLKPSWTTVPVFKVLNNHEYEIWVTFGMCEHRIYKKHPEPTELFF